MVRVGRLAERPPLPELRLGANGHHGLTCQSPRRKSVFVSSHSISFECLGHNPGIAPGTVFGSGAVSQRAAIFPCPSSRNTPSAALLPADPRPRGSSRRRSSVIRRTPKTGLATPHPKEFLQCRGVPPFLRSSRRCTVIVLPAKAPFTCPGAMQLARIPSRP